jgi:hypothetical protein
MKHKKRLKFFLMCISFFTSFGVQAQLSTLGREFYVGFMENNPTSQYSDEAMISITANEDASGSLTYGSNVIQFNLTKGKFFTHSILSSDYDLLHRDSEVIESKSLRIVSSGDIAVHAFNLRTNSSDGTVVLPISSLGKDYFVTAHHNPPANTTSDLESTLLVVAVEDNTQVEIIPSAGTVKGNGAGNSILVTLNSGQTYQVKANGDLTGSRVRVTNGTEGDCKNIAVFGGNKITYGGSCGLSGDHLFQQAFPVFTWGKSFTHIPLLGRTSGEIVKVLASENDTEVFVNGQTKGIINQGKFLQIEFSKDEVAIVETSKPSAVSVIAKSMDCNESSSDLFGDPFLLTYNPNNQTIEQAIFNSLSGGGFINHYVNILLETASISKTFLNNKAIDSEFKPVPGNPQLSFARIKVPSGPNSLSNPDGFIAYGYGAGFRVSYGFSAGANLESTKFETESTYDFEVIGDRVACLNQEGTWTIDPENDVYSVFTWDFGDGSAKVNGSEVVHTYESEGKFQVRVLASSGNGNCGIERNFTFEVEVKKVTVDLVGPENTCSEEELTYTLENPVNFDRILWDEVVGGEIVSKTDESITVRWLDEFEEGKITATPIAENGCLGDKIELTVKIGAAQVDVSPLGSNKLCGPIVEILPYEVPNPASDKSYEWFVKGGEIKSGQNTAKVDIIWDITAAETEIYFLETSSSNAQGVCPIISKTLVVSKIDPLSINSISLVAPSCSGEGGGAIILDVSGGSGEHDISWSHQPNLNSGTAEDLEAGIYTVTIKDRSGCGVLVREIELLEPEKMSLNGALELLPTTCAGGSDGGFKAKIIGGVPPYSVEGIASTWDGNYLTVSNLTEGNFSLFILDSKGCSLPVGGEIKGAQPITVSFVQESPGCPGDNNGELSVVVTGGQAPYSYSWGNGGVFIASTANTKTLLSSSANLMAMPSGEYVVTITDLSGCVINAYGVIPESKPLVRMPTGFMPKDGIYAPVSNCFLDFRMQILNRWGQVVYSGVEGWDGLFRGDEAPRGNYSYVLSYQYPMEGSNQFEEIQGVFTLIR